MKNLTIQKETSPQDVSFSVRENFRVLSGVQKSPEMRITALDVVGQTDCPHLSPLHKGPLGALLCLLHPQRCCFFFSSSLTCRVFFRMMQ